MKKIIGFSFLLGLLFFLVSGVIDLNNLFNYENQNTPSYVSKDNSPLNNQLTDAGATLGRVLFYDKKLSTNNTIACGSCHLQEFGFGDTALVSVGVNGITKRHSMRLINARYSDEVRAFWDERASSFEDQASQPIKDHVEMGYSGTIGDPDINDLINKLDTVDYYNPLFKMVYGDTAITEERMKNALAQFVRSIESYDSKFDSGRAQVTNNAMDFPNFTIQENEGKTLFFTHPPQGGAGCNRCHGGPEFSIVSNCANNGVLGVANNIGATDTTVTKAPSLRDLVNPQGMMNGPLMHDGSLKNLMEVVNHYNDLVEVPNTDLDFRLSGANHDINLTQNEKDALISFLNTLTGAAVYTDEKWSDPFDAQGNIAITELTSVNENIAGQFRADLFPNPAQNQLNIKLSEGRYQLTIFSLSGNVLKSVRIGAKHVEDLNEMPSGVLLIHISNLDSKEIHLERIIKN